MFLLYFHNVFQSSGADINKQNRFEILHQNNFHCSHKDLDRNGLNINENKMLSVLKIVQKQYTSWAFIIIFDFLSCLI